MAISWAKLNSTGVENDATGFSVAQTVLGFATAALHEWLARSDTKRHAWTVISLLAFTSAGQVIKVRTIDVPEISTAMATPAYIDLLVDPRFFHCGNRPQNTPRNRRLFFIYLLLLGSFIGASRHRYIRPAFSLLLSAIRKAAIYVALTVLPETLERGPKH